MVFAYPDIQSITPEFLGKKSKRVPVRLHHKIEKRSNKKAHRERKEAKKHPEIHRKKMNDKLNIPNCFPYKIVYLLSKIEDRKLLKEEEQLRRELAKQRKEELVGRAEGREDAMQDESSSELYSDSMNENNTDSRVCSAMCDKYSFLFLNKLLNNHRLGVPQGPQNMKPNIVASAASPIAIQIQKPAFESKSTGKDAS